MVYAWRGGGDDNAVAEVILTCRHITNCRPARGATFATCDNFCQPVKAMLVNLSASWPAQSEGRCSAVPVVRSATHAEGYAHRTTSWPAPV